MNTPTPMTDEIIEQSWRSINFPNSPIPAKFARQLETELATVTEQRDEMARAIIRFNSGTCCLPYLVDLALRSLNQTTP